MEIPQRGLGAEPGRSLELSPSSQVQTISSCQMLFYACLLPRPSSVSLKKTLRICPNTRTQHYTAGAGSARSHPCPLVATLLQKRLIDIVKYDLEKLRLTAVDTEDRAEWRTLVVDPLPEGLRAKLHYTDTGYGHHQRTSSQQFYNKFVTSQCQSPTSRHVKMLGCGKFLSVGGVRCRCS